MTDRLDRSSNGDRPDSEAPEHRQPRRGEAGGGDRGDRSGGSDRGEGSSHDSLRIGARRRKRVVSRRRRRRDLREVERENDWLVFVWSLAEGVDDEENALLDFVHCRRATCQTAGPKIFLGSMRASLGGQWGA